MKKYIITCLLILFVLAPIFKADADCLAQSNPNPAICIDADVGETQLCGALQTSLTPSIITSNICRKGNIVITNIALNAYTDTYTINPGDCLNKTLHGRGSSGDKACLFYASFHPQDKSAPETAWYSIAYSEDGYIKYGLGYLTGKLRRPIIQLSADSAAFGMQTVDASAEQKITMQNIGNKTLTITGMTIEPGSPFSLQDDCGDSLVAGGACTLTITFKPTQAIGYVSSIDLSTDDSGSPQQISLSGTGMPGGTSDINIDKLFINFGSQTSGDTYSDTITIKNTGTVGAYIEEITEKGTGFSDDTDCIGDLAPDATCTIDVNFMPTVAGAYAGTITVVSNAEDNPHLITLLGMGASPHAAVVPGSFDFGDQTVDKSSQAQRFELENIGTSLLTIEDISASSSDYELSNGCQDTLLPKDSCPINVTFKPTERGNRSATITITSDDPDSPTTAYLFGKGIVGPDIDISPGIYDFGTTPVGETGEQQDFMIMNTGDGDVTLGDIAVGDDFDKSDDCPEVLSEDDSCTVETTFVPLVSGNILSNLLVNDSTEIGFHKAHLMGHAISSDITLLPAGVDFGDQTTGRPSLAHDVRIFNSGTETITIASIASSSSVFTQTNDCDAPIAPNDFCTVSTTFTPAAEGYASGQIVIEDSTAGSPHNIDLMGSGIDPSYPDLDVSPNTWDFEHVLLGSTSTAKEFIVKNTGLVDVSISAIHANNNFAIASEDCVGTLVADQVCTITGTFTPRAAGGITGYIVIIDNTYDGHQDIYLEGSGISPAAIDINFSESALDFGSTAVNGESSAKSIAITNSGEGDAMIGDISFAGSEAQNFSFNSDCSNRILGIGTSCSINVTFLPQSSGLKTARLIIDDDAADSPQNIILSGTGGSNSGGGCSLTDNISSGPTRFLLMIASLFLSAIYFARRHTITRNR